MRHFIGLPVDEEGKRGIEKIVKRLQKKHWKVRWEPQEKWHVTLAFLGNIHAAPKLHNLVEGFGWFTVKFKGVDTFPKQEMSPQYGERWHGRQVRRLKLRQPPTVVLPKLIYIRLGGDLKAMQQLARQIRNGLRTGGIGFDDKPFSPHITVGRIAQDCGRAERIEIGKAVGKLYKLEIPQKWMVERVCLYQSELLPEGSKYTAVEQIKLNG